MGEGRLGSSPDEEQQSSLLASAPGRCPHHTIASDGRPTSSGVSSAEKLGERVQMGCVETRQAGTE